MGILIPLLTIPFRVLINFYGLCYSITLYKQAESATLDKEKTSSLNGIVAVWLISLIFLGLIIFSIFKFVTSPAFSKLMQSNTPKTSQPIQLAPLTQDEADMLAQDTFDKVNSYRKSKNLTPLEEVQSLCAYAQKRLRDFSANGKYDDAAGLMEDRKNSDTVSLYFSDFTNNAELYIPLSHYRSADDIVKAWDKNSSTNQLLNLKDYTSGCVRAVPEHLSFILALPKSASTSTNQ